MMRTRTRHLTTSVAAMSVLLLALGAPAANAQGLGDGLGGGEDDGGGPLADVGDVLDPDQFEGLDELSPEQLEDLLDTEGLEELSPEQLQGLIDTLMDQAPGGGEGGGDEGDDSDPADAPDENGDGSGIPGADAGAFTGVASARGLFVGVGLPDQLAEPLEPLLEGLGIDGDDGDPAIAINVAETNAELRRAAAGEDVDGLAEALVLNAVLGSEQAGAPGACQGNDMTVEIPDEQTPLLTLDVANIDCEQDDERAFADAQLAGVEINLGNLIDLAGAEALRDGFDQVLEPVNDQLLGAINDACPDALGGITDGLDQLPILDADGDPICDAVELDLENVFDVDVPLLDVELLEATSEVTNDGATLVAEGRSGLANLSLGGLVCVEGPEQNEELEFLSRAQTDGQTGQATRQAPETTARLCDNPALAQILDAEELLNSVEIAGQGLADIVDVQELTDAIEDGLDMLLVDTEESLTTAGETNEEGAGAAASSRLDIVNLGPFREVEGLSDTPLGDITVNVTAMDTTAAVNAGPAPAGPGGDPDPDEPAPDPNPEPAGDPDPDPGPLPNTGAGAAGVVGLAALGGAAALRRRHG